MGSRIELDTELKSLSERLGATVNVYFQPPESVKIEYPCIIYSLDDIRTLHADNQLYKTHHRYSVIVVTRNPDDALIDTILDFDFCSFNRYYVADNLHHYVYEIYY